MPEYSESAAKWVWEKMDALREAVTMLYEENLKLKAELVALKSNPQVVIMHHEVASHHQDELC